MRTPDCDLPLFQWQQPECEIIPFPGKNRVAKIRRAAEMLESTTDRGAAAYWRRLTDDMARQMARAGISAERIEAEIEDFFGEVLKEVHRHGGFGNRHGNGDGAA
ncbi:DUF6074 family protein [Consotaella salsifontis]|uniref:DUF6074 family protein n=1 Tax=Consotaella salsifontis TaxID=1365950 RepID=UPI003CCA0BA0